MREVPGSKTAINRNNPPAPMAYLKDHGCLEGKRILDYGCGRQTFYGMEGYDPAHNPDVQLEEKAYDVIYCGYVLNVVTPETEQKVVQAVFDLLAPSGFAYFAVRRDLPREGKKGNGCYQRYVEYGFPPIYEANGKYAIYRLQRLVG